MREENFIAFWVVCGFFAGVSLALVGDNSPAVMLLVTMGTTLFFYLLAHVSIAFFIRFAVHAKVHFERESYESRLDHFFNQLHVREAQIDANQTFLESERLKEEEERDDGEGV